MDRRLWAPWRETFVTQRRRRGCIFCTKPREKDDAKNYIFMRRRHSFAMLNLYPYNNGHVMVVPYRHVRSFESLSRNEIAALLGHVQDCQKMLRKVLKPNGFNIGLNEGRAAGSGYKDHIHIHVVPRWDGDTNFMPVLSQSKVISQSLSSLYRKISHAHAR